MTFGCAVKGKEVNVVGPPCARATVNRGEVAPSCSGTRQNSTVTTVTGPCRRQTDSVATTLLITWFGFVLLLPSAPLAFVTVRIHLNAHTKLVCVCLRTLLGSTLEPSGNLVSALEWTTALGRTTFGYPQHTHRRAELLELENIEHTAVAHGRIRVWGVPLQSYFFVPEETTIRLAFTILV